MDTKQCRKCHEVKTLDSFYQKMSGKYAGYIQTYCKACHSKRAIAYYEDRKDQRREIQKAWYHKRIKEDPQLGVKLKMRRWELKLGLSAGWYENMFAEQNGVCAICNKQEGPNGTRKHFEAERRRLSIDHCHTRNIARGLLCMSCNTKLAVLEDKDFVAKAQAYLQKYP